MNHRASTKRSARVLFKLRGVLYMILLTLLFYTPTVYLIPDEIWGARWLTWCLGWTAAYAVNAFSDWYFTA